MKPALALLLCIAVPMSVFADDNSYKVTYDGGSLPELKSGTGMRLLIESKQIRLVRDKADVILIPASAVTEMSYWPRCSPPSRRSYRPGDDFSASAL